MLHKHRAKLITEKSPAEFFQESVGAAMHNQCLEADENTVYYLVHLLTRFIRAENLFHETEKGIELRPLAFIYADAVAENSRSDRNEALQKLGDIALFISGFFADSLDRKAVDVDYYMAMGGGAYGTLADSLRGTLRGSALVAVYRELAEKFPAFVDVLAQISEEALGTDTRSLLRLYELWMRTGSPRLAARLRALGVEPNRTLNLNAH